MGYNLSLIDLTHTLSPEVPTWDGGCGFQSITKLDYDQCTGATKFKVQAFNLNAGIGTHIDAPAHCFKEGLTVAELKLEQLICSLYVLDVSHKASAEYYISVDDIRAFEEQYGKIARGAFVLGYTGWGKYWSDPVRYRNVDATGVVHCPGLSPETVQFLLERDVAGIGIDTLSPDGSDMTFPVHRLLLSRNKYIVENVAYHDALAPVGASVILAPLKVAQGTEAPIRMYALVSTNLA